MLALKAALYTKGNEEMLIERAIEAYIEDKPNVSEVVTCGNCCKDYPVAPREMVIPERNIRFQDVPLGYCPDCKIQIGSLFLFAALERLAKQLPDGTTMSLSEALTYKG